MSTASFEASVFKICGTVPVLCLMIYALLDLVQDFRMNFWTFYPLFKIVMKL